MTTNALAIYDKITDPIAASKSLAVAVASVVGGTNIDQGQAIALVCICEGIHPIDFSRRYHWIPGKGASMRADAMLAEFAMNHGGTYERIEKSTTRAAINFTKDGKIYNCELNRRGLFLSRWPWAKEDKSAGTLGWFKANAEVYRLIAEGKTDDEIFRIMQPHFKDNYGTELDWQNMLWVRLVSDSIRSICSEINAGIYTPEEMQDVDNDTLVVAEQRAKPPTAAELLGRANVSPPTNGNGSAILAVALKSNGVTTRAEPTPVIEEVVDDGPTFVPDESQIEQATAGPQLATSAQLDRLQSLRGEINLSNDEWNAALAKRNVHAARSLTSAQAQELIDKMTARKQQLASVPN
jgi:hypothetical protein